MLVLRRRPCESIVFDGGLRIKVNALQDQRAWLAISAPELRTEIVLATIATTPDHACIAVRGPSAIAREADGALALDVQDDDLVLLVNRALGEAISFPGLRVSVAAIETDRAVLALELAAVSGRLTISAFPATGGEVKIGIEAPREVRVFREEVWRELESANTSAGEQWSPSDLAALSNTRRRP
jgi:sRNA-binding carbon storage regulator CsrA